jgi:DNA polymerase III subunit gamma/tau
MENFIVSARKYRPATFDTVVGQQHITTTLKNALRSNHLAQAFLFCGPRGVGKTTCARILAKTINCLTPTADYEACGTCDSCQAFQKNGSLNVYELDAASNNSVDDIRSLVEQVRFPPQVGKKKVYIIDEVHMLSTAAFNAFLKTLEEPPSYVIFILATTEKHKIIPTILSRCQIFDFKRIEVKDMADHLKSIAQKETIQADYSALELIAQKADGGLRDALSMFDMITTFSTDRSIDYQTTVENLHILDYDYYFQMTEALLTENLAQAYLILDDILRKGFDGHNFVVGLAKHFRDVLVCKDASTIKLLEVPEKAKKQYAEQTQKAPTSFLISAMNVMSQADFQYKNSKNPRLLVELALTKLAHINAALQWSDVSIQDLEKKKVVEPNTVEYNTTHKTQQVQENGATPYTPKAEKQAFKIPNLQALNQEINAKKAETTAQVLKNPFGKDDIFKVLEFVKKLDDYKQNVKILQMVSKMPEILDNFVVKFELEKEQIPLFQTVEEHFLKSFKKQLQNDFITFQVVEIELTKEVRPYSNFQKYEYLAVRYPALLVLKDSLGLEVDN